MTELGETKELFPFVVALSGVVGTESRLDECLWTYTPVHLMDNSIASIHLWPASSHNARNITEDIGNGNMIDVNASPRGP